MYLIANLETSTHELSGYFSNVTYNNINLDKNDIDLGQSIGCILIGAF